MMKASYFAIASATIFHVEDSCTKDEDCQQGQTCDLSFFTAWGNCKEAKEASTAEEAATATAAPAESAAGKGKLRLAPTDETTTAPETKAFECLDDPLEAIGECDGYFKTAITYYYYDDIENKCERLQLICPKTLNDTSNKFGKKEDCENKCLH